MQKPLTLTIITINYNNVLGLQKTIESVANQTYTDFEHIIIDGGSTDNSVDVIKQFGAKINYWISEPDKGVYDAMNKGIVKANGEYLLFLNSGDCLPNNKIINKVQTYLNETDIVYGNGIIKQGNKTIDIINLPKKLSIEYFLNQSLFHPSTYIKKELFIKYGLYNDTNKIISDWEFFLKTIGVNKTTYKHLPFILSVFEHGGLSTQKKNEELINKEKIKMFNTYIPKLKISYHKQSSFSFLIELRLSKYFILMINKFRIFLSVLVFKITDYK